MAFPNLLACPYHARELLNTNQGTNSLFSYLHFLITYHVYYRYKEWIIFFLLLLLIFQSLFTALDQQSILFLFNVESVTSFALCVNHI